MHTQPRSSLQDDSSLGMCDRGLLRTCTTEIKKIDVCTCIDNLNDLNQTFRYALSEPFQQPFQGRNVTPPAPVWERSVNIVRDWVHTLVAKQDKAAHETLLHVAELHARETAAVMASVAHKVCILLLLE